MPKVSIKAVILSAGQGRRLLPMTKNSPKCLLPIAGKTIIEWQIDALLAAGIEEISIVTGFQPAKLKYYYINAIQITIKLKQYLIRSSKLLIILLVAGWLAP